MYCIVGLGNPGHEYHETRHNAGFLVVDRIADECGATINRSDFRSLYCKVNYQGYDILLVKPQTYMNLSGEAVAAITAYYKVNPDHVLVIYDDLDLPLGGLRFRQAGSAGGHKGLTSIINILKTQAIPRLRVGIGRPPAPIPVVDYVLTKFTKLERPVVEGIVSKGAQAGLAFVTHGVNYTMNHFNITPSATNNAGQTNR